MDPASIQDLFQELGAVRTRRMFGGQGVYSGSHIFGLEVAGEIYLKTDEETRGRFEEAGSRPFTFEKDGKPVSTSYWLLPGEALDDPAEAARWGRMALETSLRAAERKSRRARRS